MLAACIGYKLYLGETASLPLPPCWLRCNTLYPSSSRQRVVGVEIRQRSVESKKILHNVLIGYPPTMHFCQASHYSRRIPHPPRGRKWRRQLNCVCREGETLAAEQTPEFCFTRKEEHIVIFHKKNHFYPFLLLMWIFCTGGRVWDGNSLHSSSSSFSLLSACLPTKKQPGIFS